MADKFFTEEENNEETPQEDVIKVGEKEYSQEDLQKLVGLGEMASEASEKYKTPIDRVYPEFTKATQAKADLERKIAELEAKVNQPVTTESNGELSSEQKETIKKTLNDLGYGAESYRQIVREELATKDLVADINTVVENAKESGNPSTTAEDLAKFMVGEGIKSPARAYKMMFEDELDALKEKKLESIKPTGMTTVTSSQAGGKTPQPVKVTKANLQELVQEALNTSGN